MSVYTYADESQSGFRMFNELNDDTADVMLNWAALSAAGGRPTQYKFGFAYADRSRDFLSRRFHYIPITTQKADAGNLLFDNTPPAGADLRREQYRDGVSIQRGDSADRWVPR